MVLCRPCASSVCGLKEILQKTTDSEFSQRYARVYGLNKTDALASLAEPHRPAMLRIPRRQRRSNYHSLRGEQVVSTLPTFRCRRHRCGRPQQRQQGELHQNAVEAVRLVGGIVNTRFSFVRKWHMGSSNK